MPSVRKKMSRNRRRTSSNQSNKNFKCFGQPFENVSIFYHPNNIFTHKTF